MPKSSAAVESPLADERPKLRQDPTDRVVFNGEKHGLPPMPPMNCKWEQFIPWWRSVSPAKRTCITVYAYRLFPVLDLPPNEHAVMIIPGEQPIGGEEGSPEEALLNAKGLGNYYFTMKYNDATVNRVILKGWLFGYRDNLPGFRDWKNHPPIIGSVKEVVLTDEQNIKSGYISYLRSQGHLPGEAEKERGEDMAESTATSTAIGVLGDIAKSAFAKAGEQQPVAPPVEKDEGTDRAWNTVERAVSTVHQMQRENAQPTTDPVALIREVATFMKPADPPPPPDFTPFTEQVANLTNKIIDMHGERANDLRTEITEMRKDFRALASERAVQMQASTTPPAPVVDPLDAIVNAAEKMNKVKEALGVKTNPGDEDDRPRGRRRRDDDEDAPETPWWQEAVKMMPLIVTGLAGLATSVGVALHNARIVQKGEGDTILPPMPDVTQVPSYANPGAALPSQQQLRPTPQPNPQSNGGGDGGNMESFTRFMQTIEAGFVGAMERQETGFEYAELFIKTQGRTGEWGYAALRSSHSIGQLNPHNIPFPQGSVQAIAAALRMYPPIWTKIGADPRLPDFLLQFATYDSWLADYEAPNIATLLFNHECRTVQEFIDLPEDDEEAGEATGENDAAEAVSSTPITTLASDSPVLPKPKPQRQPKPTTTIVT